MFNISLPINSYIVSKTLANVASFDVIPTQFIYFEAFDFKRTYIPNRFEMIGLDGNNFLMNSGTLFLVFISWFLTVPLYFCAKLCTNTLRAEKAKVVLRIVSRWIFFNYLIRVLLESYVDLTLTSLLNLKNASWEFEGEKIASIFSFFVICCIILFTILTLLFFFKYS